jgi:hypothetical protein
MAVLSDPFASQAFPEGERGLESERSLDGEHEMLAGIAAKLVDIAAQLKRAAASQAGTFLSAFNEVSAYSADDSAAFQGSALALARHAYAMRRQRAAIFGTSDLFGEPAWDILLDLYIAQAEGKPVSVSSACIGSASPPTTGLRWLAVLTERGLIARTADEQDHRRIMVHLTERGMAAMEQFLALARDPAAKA